MFNLIFDYCFILVTMARILNEWYWHMIVKDMSVPVHFYFGIFFSRNLNAG
jgi:hypothetical protein